MKLFRRIFLVAMMSAGFSAGGMPNTNPVKNSDDSGFARFTKLDFPLCADDGMLMFYLEFSTNPAIEPGMFGAFWHMPVFSSKIEAGSSGSLRWLAPNGRIYSFCAHLSQKNEKGATTYVDNRSIWKAEKKKNGFFIESMKDGSTFTYSVGRLVEFSFVSMGRYFVSYRADGRPLSVRDKSGKAVLSFEYGGDQMCVKRLTDFNGAYEFEYSPQRAGELLNVDAFTKGAALLSEIRRPLDAGVEKLSYEKSAPRPRIILSRELAESSTPPLQVNKMSLEADGNPKGWIEWCASTGLIMADNDGEYKIGNDKFDSFLPGFNTGRPNPKYSISPRECRITKSILSTLKHSPK